MKKKPLRTFGPAVEQRAGEPPVALCTWCIFRVNQTCTHVAPGRRLDDGMHTPDWCEMKGDMLADVAAETPQPEPQP